MCEVAPVVTCTLLTTPNPSPCLSRYDTPFPLAFEMFYVPDQFKVFDAIKKSIEY